MHKYSYNKYTADATNKRHNETKQQASHSLWGNLGEILVRKIVNDLVIPGKP